MRALLGLLILAGIFAMAARWQGRRSEALRDERSHRYGIPAADDTSSDDWSTLVLGRPSGAAPLPAPLDLVPEDPGGDYRADPLDYAPEYLWVVQKNEFLGGICDRHYGTSKPRVVQALATYNGLASPDDIREGQQLMLPDMTVLLGD